MSDPARTHRNPTWRILARKVDGDLSIANEGELDEVVIGDWLHVEKMDRDTWWMRLGDARVVVVVRKDGKHRVLVERGEYADEEPWDA